MPSVGGTLHFADKDALKGSLLKTLTSVRPTKFVAVPRVFEKMHQQLEMAFSQAKGPKAQLLKWATSTSLSHYNDLLAGKQGDIRINVIVHVRVSFKFFMIVLCIFYFIPRKKLNKCT